jgi:hypothetical protein
VNNLALTVWPCRVNSSVGLDVFQLFWETGERKEIQITKQNISNLSQLRTEFGLVNLSKKISAFLHSPDYANTDTEARARILDVEERVLQ